MAFDAPSCTSNFPARPQLNTTKRTLTPNDLNYEEYRLRTFRSWPVQAPISPERLAKAGFYYLGNGLEVVCFSCEGRISDWTYGDIVMQKHLQYFPRCKFVKNQSNNVSLSRRSEETTNGYLENGQHTLDTPECIETREFPFPSPSPSSSRTVAIHTKEFLNRMKYESERLATFRGKWPVDHISPIDLARAGFFYFDIGDKVRCAFCLGVLTCWSPGDKPYMEHIKNFPTCAFVMGRDVGNIPNGGDVCGSGIVSGRRRVMPQSGPENRPYTSVRDLESLGVTVHKGPQHPSQASRDARIRSFQSWPRNSPIKAEELAEAGFFYVGIKDNTKCFYCDGGLSNWEPGDRPWEEHARWFPTCAFVKINKGANFIRDSYQRNADRPERPFVHCAPLTNGYGHQSSEDVLLEGIELQPVPSSSSSSESTSITLLEEQVEAAMQSSLVNAFMRANVYPAQLVRLAILRKLQMTGSGIHSVDELSDAVFKVKNGKSEIFKVSEDKNEKSNLEFSKMEYASSLTSESTGSASSLEEENRQLKEQRMCKICMDQEVGVVFLPCGHLIACVQCGPALKDCALCRTPIEGTIRTFLS